MRSAESSKLTSREKAITSAVVEVLAEIHMCPDIALSETSENSFMFDLRAAIETTIKKHEKKQ